MAITSAALISCSFSNSPSRTIHAEQGGAGRVDIDEEEHHCSGERPQRVRSNPPQQEKKCRSCSNHECEGDELRREEIGQQIARKTNPAPLS